jgi:hypothetical protein
LAHMARICAEDSWAADAFFFGWACEKTDDIPWFIKVNLCIELKHA